MNPAMAALLYQSIRNSFKGCGPCRIHKEGLIYICHGSYVLTFFTDTDAMRGKSVIFCPVLGKDLIIIPKLFLQFLYDLFSKIIHSLFLLLTTYMHPVYQTPSS